MRRALLAVCATVGTALLLSPYLLGCDRQSVHFSAKQMSSLVVTRVPIVLQGHNVRISGTIELLVVVGTDGIPTCISVVRGHPILTSAAIDSVKNWRFRAYRRNRSFVSYSGSLVIDAKEFVEPG